MRFCITCSVAHFAPQAAPPVVPEREEQNPAPANACLVKSQTPQNPVASSHAPRRPRPPAPGSQTKARAPDFDGGPTVPHVKNLNNNHTPVMVRPQTVALRTTAVSAMTQDDTEPVPTQQISSGSSASGTSSPKKNKRKQKKVRYLYCHGCSRALTDYKINRFGHRGVQQPKQAPLQRKARRLSRTPSLNHVLCSVTWYTRWAGPIVLMIHRSFRDTPPRQCGTSAGTTCINSVRATRVHTITTPLW